MSTLISALVDSLHTAALRHCPTQHAPYTVVTQDDCEGADRYGIARFCLDAQDGVDSVRQIADALLDAGGWMLLRSWDYVVVGGQVEGVPYRVRISLEMMPLMITDHHSLN